MRLRSATRREKRDDHGHYDNDAKTKPVCVIDDDDDDDDFESNYEQMNMGDQRRKLRSDYGAMVNFIKEKTDDIGKADSKKFKAIIDEVEKMHQLDFISCLLSKFGHEKRHIHWKELGLQVSPVFKRCGGCCTMMRPKKLEFKQRKVPTYRRPRTKRSIKENPEQLKHTNEEKSDTDTNMAVMFEILKKKRRVKLENLVLNRKSFAQTVENVFALSFLVKDGRVLIVVDKNGSHLVSPRNAPSSRSIMSREVEYSHFIFRIDFRDWKLMKTIVPEGEELMPVRNAVKSCGASQEEDLMAMFSQSELNYAIKAELLSENFQEARTIPKTTTTTTLPQSRTIPLKTYSRRPRVLVDRENKVERMC